jgi:alanyl-tRNA synthetase
LGTHANQQGSLVAADRLRFDLTHRKAITPEEIEAIEKLVNDAITNATALKTTVEDLEAAKARGVTALFGEKYDQAVRVVDIGGYSTELCGGTHCRSTGEIGAFAIVSEAAVQAGVRRIEAVTRDAAVKRMQDQRRTLRELGQLLKSGEADLLDRVRTLQDQVKELKKGGSRAAQQDTNALAKLALSEAIEVNGVKVIMRQLEGISGKDLSQFCDALRVGQSQVCGVVGLEADGKAMLAAFATADLAGKRVHAGNLIKAMAGIVGGGGGGRPDFAQAGGKDPSRIGEALDVGLRAIKEAL